MSKTIQMKNVLFIVMLLTSSLGYAQDSKENSRDKWYTGGGVNFSAGNQFIAIGLNPILGYHFTEKISGGVGATASFIITDFYTDKFYGANVFGRYNITNELFAQSEFHMTNVLDRLTVVGEEILESRVWSPQWFVGGGYRSSVGNNMFVNITVLWDVIEDENSPYINPYIRGGIQIGF